MTCERSRHLRGLRFPQASAVYDVGEKKNYHYGHWNFGIYGGPQDQGMVATGVIVAKGS